jgi:hypothetical protein
MEKMNGWTLMIFLLAFTLSGNLIKGMQEVREKVNKEGKLILENIDGYAQKAEIAAEKSERACFSLMRELFQKTRSRETESDMWAQKEQVKKGRERK